MLKAFADARPVYTIDASDRIVFVNAAWLDFVRPELAQAPLSEIIGTPIRSLLQGLQVRQLWELLYSRVRGAVAPLFVPMRADTPSERRLIDIELRPLADRSIEHICERVWTETRPAVALLDASYPRDARTLRSCHWCRRVQVRLGLWEEIEVAQRSLGIEAGPTLPTLQSAVCTTCKQSLLKTFPARVA